MKLLSPRQIGQCLWKATVDTIYHDGIEHAGYLAFLGLLALFPFLVFTVALIGVLGQGNAGTEFITWVLQALPKNLTAALQPRVVEIVSGPPQGLLTASILGAIWTASSAVEGLRTILNRAYRVQTPPAYLLRRSLSIVQLLIFTFIMISAMLLVVTVPIILHSVEDILGMHLIPENRNYVNRLVFFVSVSMLFAAICAIYYTIPNIKQGLMSVVPGAVLVVLLWIGAAYLLTSYLSHFEQVNLIYGSLGGIIATLVLFYICNMIFIFGAEFNYQIFYTLGLRIIQKENVETSKDVPTIH
jgi:membrane protein